MNAICDLTGRAARAALAMLTLLASSALAAPTALAAPAASSSAAPASALDLSAWRIPGGYEPLGAVWLGYDAGHAEWTAALVSALAPHVKLKMLVPSDAVKHDAQATLLDLGAPVDGVQFHVDSRAAFFVQDAAVFALGPQGELGLVDLKWNGYGLPAWCANRYASDAKSAAECAASVDPTRDALSRSIAQLSGAKVIATSLYLEGGGLEVNGRGVVIANEALLKLRNPGRSRGELQRALLELPGIRKVLWLPSGLAEDPHLRSTIVGPYVGWGTGGHTDQFVRFADERTVLLAWVDGYQASLHPVARLNRQRMQTNFEILSRATDAQGRPLRVIKLPMPRNIERKLVLTADADTGFSEQWTAADFPPTEQRQQGDPVIQVAPASYLNFVVANAVVLVPDYQRAGTSAAVQAKVRATFERVFPGRHIQFVDSIAANWYGGGPHCAALSQPLSR